MIVEGTTLKMIRGDTESITVTYADESGIQIPLVVGDTIYLTIKKRLKDTEKVFQKIVTEFTEGNALIVFSHTDTNTIPTGTYVYDIQLNKADGTVTTIIYPSDFELLGGVTDE